MRSAVYRGFSTMKGECDSLAGTAEESNAIRNAGEIKGR
jgi:hypothetical protein